MWPAINFATGLVAGLVVGVVLSGVLVFLFGGFANAMGARTRMHKASAFPVLLRVLDSLRHHIAPEDLYHVDMAAGLIKSELESARK